MAKDLKGHRAVVTGASSGIGEEYARQLAARGADLVIVARRVDRLQSLAAKLGRDHEVRAQVLQLDLSAPGAALKLYEKATHEGERVTILINNAGIGPFAHFVDSTLEKHVETIRLNVETLTGLCYHFSRHMLKHSHRSYITNVGSIASFQGVPSFAVYSATKSYVGVFSEILGRELEGTNVSVTCLCPGGTYTEFMAANGQALKPAAKSVMMSAEAVVSQGMRGMLGHRAYVIPGIGNKLACVLPRFLPRSLALTLADIALSRNASPVGLDHKEPKG